MHHFLRIALPAAAFLLLSANAGMADNWGHQNGGGGSGTQYHQNGGGNWRQGYWAHGPYNGRSGWWWVSGGQYYYYPAPVYPYPAYVPPAVVVQPSYPQAQQYWYCANPQGYYPAVPGCYVGWQAVAAPVVQPQPQYSQAPAPAYAQPYQPSQAVVPSGQDQPYQPPQAQQGMPAEQPTPMTESAPTAVQTPAPSTAQAAPVVPVETASADAAPASNAQPSVMSTKDQDDHQFALFSDELSSISTDVDGSADHLMDLKKRVHAFHQSLFERDYNAMGELKNTEELEKKIAEKQQDLGV